MEDKEKKPLITTTVKAVNPKGTPEGAACMLLNFLEAFTGFTQDGVIPVKLEATIMSYEADKISVKVMDPKTGDYQEDHQLVPTDMTDTVKYLEDEFDDEFDELDEE